MGGRGEGSKSVNITYIHVCLLYCNYMVVMATVVN